MTYWCCIDLLIYWSIDEILVVWCYPRLTLVKLWFAIVQVAKIRIIQARNPTDCAEHYIRFGVLSYSVYVYASGTHFWFICLSKVSLAVSDLLRIWQDISHSCYLKAIDVLCPSFSQVLFSVVMPIPNFVLFYMKLFYFHFLLILFIYLFFIRFILIILNFLWIPCLISSGGSFHCATCDIRRTGELQSYF
jgi:hypothetical protein